MVSGGYDDTFLSSSEGVSLSHDLVSCPAASDLPFPVGGVAMATLDGVPVLCAGAMCVPSTHVYA